MIQLKAKVGDVERTIDAAIDSLKELDKPLQRTAKFLRFKANRRFQQQGPGWPARKAEAERRSQQRAKSVLENKLARDVRRAEASAKKSSTIESRKKVLEEFKRIEAGGSWDESTLKQSQKKSLAGRMERAGKKGERLLQRLSSSIKSEVKNGRISVYSEVEWAGIHNDGGTAGHGAQIPARTFLELEDEDLEFLENAILDHVEEKLKG